MAFPANNSYSAASGRTIFAGRYPAWRESMTANTWVEIGDTLNGIDPEDDSGINPNHPSSAPWHGTVGLAGVIIAYCGACYDKTDDVLWLPLSGGHGDYAGNEPYRISIAAESPAWEMVRNPTGALGNTGTLNDGQESTGLYFDGRPRAIHSYNKPVFVPGTGPVIAVQGNCAYSGSAGTNKPIFISPATGEMTLHGAINSYANTSSGGGACYDPSRHCIWFRGAATGYYSRYDIATDTWYQHGTSSGSAGYTSLTYLPDHDCILRIDDGLTNDFEVFDCATNTRYSPVMTGSLTGMTLTGRAQPRAYLTNGVALWDNSTDTDVINTMSFSTNPRTDTWQAGQMAVDAGNTVTPSARASNGTYGRFFHAPNLGGFGVINATNQQIYFYAIS